MPRIKTPPVSEALTFEELEKIRRMTEAGHPPGVISMYVHVPRDTIHRVIREKGYQEATVQ